MQFVSRSGSGKKSEKVKQRRKDLQEVLEMMKAKEGTQSRSSLFTFTRTALVGLMNALTKEIVTAATSFIYSYCTSATKSFEDFQSTRTKVYRDQLSPCKARNCQTRYPNVMGRVARALLYSRHNPGILVRNMSPRANYPRLLLLVHLIVPKAMTKKYVPYLHFISRQTSD